MVATDKESGDLHRKTKLNKTMGERMEKEKKKKKKKKRKKKKKKITRIASNSGKGGDVKRGGVEAAKKDTTKNGKAAKVLGA